MSERTSQITQVAAALFDAGAAEAVIVAGCLRLRAAIHLDTIPTFADCDVVTVYRSIDDIRPFTLRRAGGPGGLHVTAETDPLLDVIPRAPGLDRLRVVDTGGDSYPPSASSGTAPTTSSRCAPAKCSPMTATP